MVFAILHAGSGGSRVTRVMCVSLKVSVGFSEAVFRLCEGPGAAMGMSRALGSLRGLCGHV